MALSQKVFTALAVLAAAQSVSAHTWVEMIRRISSSGAYVGEAGYAMGHMNRSDAGFADTNVQIKFTDTTSNPPVCGSFTGYTNADYPPLNATPGEFLSLQYAENGHVSFPEQTPRGFRGGNVMIYGTSESIVGTSTGINDVLYKWNDQGTGGNQKGKLLASHFFDDGQCYENPNTSPIRAERAAKYGATNLLCQGTVQLPSNLTTSGTYSLIWVWDWPQNPNEAGINTTEIYTSCMTINLGARSNGAATNLKAFSFAKNLDVSNAAIQSQVETLIEVEQRGTGTASPASPTDVPAATSLSGAPATTSAAVLSSSRHHRSGVMTVTVTEAADTVTEYYTVTVDGGADSGSGSGSGQKTTSAASATVTSFHTSVRASRSSSLSAVTGVVSVTSVQPFLKARASGQARRLR